MSYEGLKASLGFSLFLFGMCVQARGWRLGRILVSDQQGCEFVFCCSGFEKTPPHSPYTILPYWTPKA